MAVGQDYSFKFIGVFPKVGKVRKDYVNSRHLFVRERHAGIYQDNPTLLAHGGHILADLPQSTQGHDLQGLFV